MDCCFNIIHYCRWLVCLSLFAFALPLQAQINGQESYTPHFDYFVDKGADLSFEDILALPENAFQQAPKAGYVGGYNRYVHWLRFTVPATDKGERLILRTLPSYTDYLTLYVPNQDGTYTRHIKGESVEDWQLKTDDAFIFELTGQTQAREVYLRTQSTNTNTIVATLFTLQGYWSSLYLDQTWAGVFIGLLLTFLLLSISPRRWREDTLFAYYFLFIVASLLVFLSTQRWLLLVPNSWRSWVSLMPQCTTLLYMLALSLLYYKLFRFEQSRYWRWLTHSYQFTIFIGVIALMIDLYVEYMPYFMVTSIAYLSWITLIALCQAIQRYRDSGMALFVVVFGFSGIIGTALSLSGIVSGGAFLIYSYTAGTLASILVLQSIISRRLNNIEKDRLALQLEHQHTLELIELERQEKRQKAQFVSMLSHELKTPLSVIQMGIGQPNLSASGHRYIQDAIDNMSRIVDRCSILEKVEDEVMTRIETLELHHELEQWLTNLGPNERINYHPSKSTLLVKTDADWLKVILNNIFDNAIKYRAVGSAIEIKTWQQDNQIFLEVSNICAHNELDPDRLFEKYYRSPSAQKESGSGLGLYIVKQLVKQLGGDIRCQLSDSSHQPTAYKVSILLWLPSDPSASS